MKKTLVLVLIVLMASTALFGEITFGAWGRGVLAIGTRVNADGDAAMGMRDTKSWGGNGSRIGYNMYGKAENVGYQLAFDNDGTTHTLALANIWVKPHDMIKLTIGSYNNHTLRGNAEFGSWNWLRIAPGNPAGGAQYALGPNNRWSNDSIGEDLTFARNCARNGGFLIEITPMDALYIFAAPISGPDGGMMQQTAEGDDLQSGADLMDSLKKGQYGFGYTITGVGQVKAQFIGTDLDATDDGAKGWINAAFKLTSVQGLQAELGVFLPTASEAGVVGMASGGTIDEFKQIALYAKYSGVENATIHVAGVYYIADSDLDVSIWEGALGLDYIINDQLTLNSDVRLYSEDRNSVLDADGEQFMGWALSANVSKALAAGKVGAGIEITNVAFASGMGGEEGGDVLWTIPVILEYSF